MKAGVPHLSRALLGEKKGRPRLPQGGRRAASESSSGGRKCVATGAAAAVRPVLRIEAPRRPRGPDRSAASTTRNRAARAVRARALATEPEGGGDRSEFFGRRSESGGVRLVAGNGLARHGRPGPWDRAGPVTGRRAGPARPMLVGRGRCTISKVWRDFGFFFRSFYSIFILQWQAVCAQPARCAPCCLRVEGGCRSFSWSRSGRTLRDWPTLRRMPLMLVDINADTVDTRSDDEIWRRERLCSGCIWLVCREKSRLLEKSLRLVEESPIAKLKVKTRFYDMKMEGQGLLSGQTHC